MHSSQITCHTGNAGQNEEIGAIGNTAWNKQPAAGAEDLGVGLKSGEGTRDRVSPQTQLGLTHFPRKCRGVDGLLTYPKALDTCSVGAPSTNLIEPPADFSCPLLQGSDGLAGRLQTEQGGEKSEGAWPTSIPHSREGFCHPLVRGSPHSLVLLPLEYNAIIFLFCVCRVGCDSSPTFLGLFWVVALVLNHCQGAYPETRVEVISGLFQDSPCLLSSVYPSQSYRECCLDQKNPENSPRGRWLPVPLLTLSEADTVALGLLSDTLSGHPWCVSPCELSLTV